jgi:hypothetical protein
MSTAFNLNGLAFASLTPHGGSAIVAALTGQSYSPKLGVEPFRSGGDLSPSMMRRAGAQPAIRITVPLATAWGLLASFVPIQLDSFTLYEASFTGTPALRIATGATTLALTATTGLAFAYISRIYFSGSATPLALADITILLASTDGQTDPITIGTGSVPSLAANPTLHTMGPLVDNTTAKWGVQSWSLDTGISIEPIQTDGFFYPTTYRVNAYQATATIQHNDTPALLSALGDSGKDGTGAGFILYARAYDSAAKATLTTGYSFTFTLGLANIDTVAVEGTNRAQAAIRVQSYTASGALTFPVAVATSASFPT